MDELPHINWESQIPEEQIVDVGSKTILYNVKNRNQRVEALPWWWRAPWEKLTRGQLITIKYQVFNRRYISKDGNLVSEYTIKEINLTPFVFLFAFSLNIILTYF